MGPPKLISIEEARRRVLAEVRPPAFETVPLAEAAGRVIATGAVAAEDLPPFDASAMDGFAIAAEHQGELEIVGESRAGTPAEVAVAAGQAVRISTGARVPEGTWAVVPVERTSGGTECVVVEETREGANVRRAGEDVRAGQTPVPAGTGLGPAEVAVLASLGKPDVEVARRPRLQVLVTGDELVEPGAALGPGQIRNSNGFALDAQARAAGAEVPGHRRVQDDLAATSRALAGALDAADVVCVSGGVSVGHHDHVRPALAELGAEERFWGVSLQPGKPTWFGVKGETLVFGLPGNPVSAMVTFMLFARPAIRALQGADPAAETGTAVLAQPVKRNARRDQAVRVRVEASRDGTLRASPTKEQFSHVLTSMLGADALAFIRAGDGVAEAGHPVDIELL